MSSTVLGFCCSDSLQCRAMTFLVQVKIQALAFSPDEQRLASLGGQDDNSLVGVAAPQLAGLALQCKLQLASPGIAGSRQ